MDENKFTKLVNFFRKNINNKLFVMYIHKMLILFLNLDVFLFEFIQYKVSFIWTLITKIKNTSKFQKKNLCTILITKKEHLRLLKTSENRMNLLYLFWPREGSRYWPS